jgi:hypothetical protein
MNPSPLSEEKGALLIFFVAFSSAPRFESERYQC